MKMLRAFKRVMRRLTPLEVATTELAEAELSRLEAQSASEYAAAMVGYHTKRIERLRKEIATYVAVEAQKASTS